MLDSPNSQQLSTRCFVVHPNVNKEQHPDRDPSASLSEVIGLARAINLEVVHKEIIALVKPRPAAFLGQGSIDRLKAMIYSHHNGHVSEIILIMDCILSPIQQRNLEQSLNCKVIDRTALIIEIFGARARTKEGRLQVDLAALTYQRSRLVRSWTHLERQRGGAGFLGGPGERQIELDRRLIDQRINRINRELKAVKRTRQLHRNARKRVPYPIVALVGYTNAGKSTLFNLLTNANVMAEDQLFATLDPTMRALNLPNTRKSLLLDTVGFISSLPHELINAFHATLEEVIKADLIIHVRDVSHPAADIQKRDVEFVLRQIGIGHTAQARMIEVQNKIDLLNKNKRRIIINRANRSGLKAVPFSALTGEGKQTLLDLVSERLTDGFEVLDLKINHSEGHKLAWLYENGEVLSRSDSHTGVSVKVRLSPVHAARYQQSMER